MGSMTHGIVHHQRLAWDCALAFTSVADSDYYWLCGNVRRLLGPQYEQALSGMRTRLMYPVRSDAPQVEAGLWRARIEDALRERPEIVYALADLVAEVRRRAEALYPIG